ncbi:hypothetical protein AOLI_G00027160 [Acnodon oligacanthus]
MVQAEAAVLSAVDGGRGCSRGSRGRRGRLGGEETERQKEGKKVSAAFQADFGDFTAESARRPRTVRAGSDCGIVWCAGAPGLRGRGDRGELRGNSCPYVPARLRCFCGSGSSALLSAAVIGGNSSE